MQRTALLSDLFTTPGSWDASGVRALRSLLILHAAVRTLFWLPPTTSWLPEVPLSPVMVGAMRLGFIVAAIASLWPRIGRWPAAAAAAGVFAQVVVSFPEVSDHFYLELFCLALVALLAADDESDGRLLRSTLCWMAVLVLFYSGIQKLLHGYYFFGELPLLAVAENRPYGELFAWILPAAEVEALRGLNLALPDAGPLRTDSALLLVASNAIWALGIVLAVLIVLPYTRQFGVLTAIVVVIIVRGAAREPFYILLMAQLFVLCIPGQWNRRLALLFVAAYVALAVGAIGLGLREGGH